MSVRIELPGERGVVAGIQFVDGAADVAELGDHSRAFFTAIGATLTDTDENAPFADLRIGEKLLTDCTVPELRELAQTEGIDVPAKATKKDLLHAFLIAFQED